MATIRCHYVPQFYLNYFLPEGATIFWVYDKKDNSTRMQPPLNTTVIGDYYLSEEGKDKTVEDYLAKIEGDTKPIFDEFVNNYSPWNDKYKSTVARFLSLMHSRVPRAVEQVKQVADVGFEVAIEKMKELAKDTNRLKKHYEGYCKDSSNRKISLKEYASFLSNPTKDGLLRFKMKDKHALKMSFDTVEVISSLFMQMNWSLCITKKSFFITSDAPLTVLSKIGKGFIIGSGFAMQNASISFPLSPKVCLVGKYMPLKNKVYVEGDYVDSINKRTIYMAERFVISTYRSNKICKAVKNCPNYQKPRLDEEILKNNFRKKLIFYS